MLEHLGSSLAAALAWQSVLAMLVGTLIGVMVGALPGLTGTMGVALAIPFTYGLPPLAALGLLAGIHNGASQGSAIPAILLNIPASPGAICTAWDGFPLTKKGHAGAAIRLSATSAAVGGMLSALSLLILAPPLATAALAFGPAEIFWVNVFGLATISALLGDDLLKGIISACFGLLIGTVGLDNVTGHERFTFGLLDLQGGVPELAVFIGVLSLPPAWAIAKQSGIAMGTSSHVVIKMTKGIWSVAEVWRVWLKSSLIGIINGILPGSAIASFVAYAEAKRSSKHPERFGHGSPEGLAAAESVNAADNASAMIPALTLGIPGSNVAALMLGALLIQGFQPGPQLFRDAPDIVYGYCWQMFFTAALIMVIGGAGASRIFAHLLRLPQALLLPLIICIMTAGIFASSNSMFDVFVCVGFGIVGLIMTRFGFPIAPIVIGVVLGGKAEFNLRIALLISNGDFRIFTANWICWIMIALTILVLSYPMFNHYRDRKRAAAIAAAVPTSTDPTGA
ncbi:MAG TPA: tripartite tricarboxylate transporter permease [Devosiaceae bacterium]|jgi:putative tricarboxylic transport membrane protein